MALRTDIFDLSGLRLASGEGRHLDLTVTIEPFELGGQTYAVVPGTVPVALDVSRTTGSGYALHLAFTASLEGPCMRCLQDATPEFRVDAREISQPNEGDELESPYVTEGQLHLNDWARDALALTLPAQILCTPACAGLCAICGIDLNAAGPEHQHESGPDPRWAKLSELRFD